MNKRYTLKNKGNGIVLTKKVVQRSGGDSRNNAVAPKGSLETSGKPEASAVLNITAPLRKDQLNFTTNLSCKASENTVHLGGVLNSTQFKTQRAEGDPEGGGLQALLSSAKGKRIPNLLL